MAQIRVAAIAVAVLDGMVNENYQRALRLVEMALRGRPDVVVLPEALAAGYCAVDLARYGEASDSAALRGFAELSRQGNCLLALGYVEKIAHPVAGGRLIRNAVRIFDRGETVGVHYKHTLWPDKNIAWRDEPAMMEAGKAIDIFPTRFGKLAVLTCYENWIEANWRTAAAGGADLIVSPYNAPGDTTDRQVKGAGWIGKPSVWANRTGTVHWPADGKPNGVMPNLGTAGIIAGNGKLVAKSQPGVEEIVTGELEVG